VRRILNKRGPELLGILKTKRRKSTFGEEEKGEKGVKGMGSTG